MSYDIKLVDPVSGETLRLDTPHHMRGGTYAIGGTTEARLNITYNYSAHLGRALAFLPITQEENDGIRKLYGMSGADSIPVLERAAARLRSDTDPDYWKPTEGNVKLALIQLLALAKMRPDGVWDGD